MQRALFSKVFDQWNIYSPKFLILYFYSAIKELNITDLFVQIVQGCIPLRIYVKYQMLHLFNAHAIYLVWMLWILKCLCHFPMIVCEALVYDQPSFLPILLVSRDHCEHIVVEANFVFNFHYILARIELLYLSLKFAEDLLWLLRLIVHVKMKLSSFVFIF